LRRGSVVLDLTVLVKEAVEGERPSYGFLITGDPAHGVGVPTADLASLQGLDAARILALYNRVGPRPPDLGRS
jgi:hypothetical protein